MGSDRRSGNRREHVLKAALTVFATYGYRKTSMDAVARAADISRPGLYFLFADKEELFRETMRHALDGALRDVREALAAPDLPVDRRLVNALDAYLGRHVGTHISEGVDALLEQDQLDGMYDDYRELFISALAEAVMAAEEPAGSITPRQIAEVLHAAATGWKHRVAGRTEFTGMLASAVSVALRQDLQSRIPLQVVVVQDDSGPTG
ncbi:TetR/AcrR family transcriptional regulator [Streptomyces flaveolus]|uniref:TetR/AcrR family transcriptional regulator n=1 Tax=Streptomyces flaveolus TaxID=67297 RepID=UPI0036FE6650